MDEVGAFEIALHVLRHRELSVAELDRRLMARGFPDEERAEALARLERTGLVDDRRFAEARATALADRGSGDALIRHDLNRAGIASSVVDGVVEALEPEEERARRVVERRGADPRTARYLGGKGFADETVAAVIASGSRDELG